MMKRAVRVVMAGAAGLAAYMLVIRPWHLKWGATRSEAQGPQPGDAIVERPRIETTRAITIQACAAEVWPWLVQIGYKRAGWYTHDFLHRLVGIAGCVDDERRSAKRIIPELQDLKVGDVVEIAPGMGYVVVGLEPEQALILHMRLDSGKWQALASNDPLPEKYLSSSWVWSLEETDERTTRLIVRVRSDYSPGMLSTLSTRIANELGRLVMQPKTLRVLKQRAETEVAQ